MYKSAHDLWDDVDSGAPATSRTARIARHTNLRATRSTGTLAQTRPAPPAPQPPPVPRRNRPTLPPPPPPPLKPSTPSVVKRTRSLLKFRKDSTGVLEGMALWRHRSLVDLRPTEEPKSVIDIDIDNNTDSPELDAEQPYSTLVKRDANGYEGTSDDEEPPASHNQRAPAPPSLPLPPPPPLDTANTTRTLPSRTRKNNLINEGHAAGNPSIFQYGRTLQSRLKRPDRGSRFDRMSITGHMCGPWYDMWGIDNSVRQES